MAATSSRLDIHGQWGREGVVRCGAADQAGLALPARGECHQARQACSHAVPGTSSPQPPARRPAQSTHHSIAVQVQHLELVANLGLCGWVGRGGQFTGS